MSLQGKVALISGGAGGLGKATVLHFLTEGAKLAVCDVNQEQLTALEKEVAEGSSPKSIFTLQTDITSETALDELFSKIQSTFGRLDVVVNCAGIIDRFDPMGTMDRDMWDRVIAVNLTAPAFIIKRAVDVFLKQDIKGSIVNVASIAAVRGFTCGAAYTASKHGLIGLTKNTAAFYSAKGIRCNAIMPGAMMTNIAAPVARSINMEGMTRMRMNFPSEGGMPLCDINQVASLIAYLSSDKAELMNGSVIAADGGATAN